MKISKAYKSVFIVGVVAAVISLGFFVAGIKKTLEASESAKEIDSQKVSIDEFLAQKPCPVQENLDAIQTDIKRLEMAKMRAEYAYGHPEQRMLDLFCQEMGGLDPRDLKVEWLKAKTKTKEGVDLSFDAFLNDYMKVKKKESNINLRDTAKGKVKNLIEKITFRKIDDIDYITRILLGALGTPPQVEPGRCQWEIHNADKFLRDALEEHTSTVIKMPAKPFYFTFEEFKDKLPPTDQIPSIMRQIGAIEYIYKMLKESQITEIIDLKRLSPVSPETLKDGNKLKLLDPATNTVCYSYELKMISTQKSLRMFTEKLYKAVQNNCFYEITKLSVVKVDLKTEEEALSMPKVEPKKNLNVEISANTKDLLPKTEEETSVPLIGIKDAMLLESTMVINYYYFLPDERAGKSKGGAQ